MSRPTVVVVGAGIIGCLVAREITDRGADAEVVVVDRDGVGTGASRRSAGLHFPRGASERVRRMTAYSEDWYGRLLGADPGAPIHPLPMAVVASSDRAAEVHEAYLPSAKLTPVAAPGDDRVVLPAGAVAWTGDGCQHADVHALSLRLARGLRPAVPFREGIAVTGLVPRADGVTLRLGSGEDLTADHVVLAPGPWIHAPAWRDLLAPHGARVKKVVALHIEDRPGPGAPCVVFHDEDAFLLPLADRGHWLFSYTCQEWDVDPDRPTDGLHAEHLAEARGTLARYAPELAARCTSGRVFCDAYTPDRRPLVRALDPAGRIVFAGGANGSGYRLAPAIAAEAVDLLDLTSSRRSQW
ncbi:NAD(P)/FAD-dependent oxidoreductase [Microtetraspora niveoalba]|uniref:NAD(P)/FAD-dependent oxidoreductase n=1 Tax=Microtetraspora niveoalba TaxID=46175 RepID=UPI00083228C0|nr:FAD-dependent oxidoreductase [Microtetraspora niveoalba]